MKLITLNWTKFEIFYILESIRNILQDSIRFEEIEEYFKSKSTSQSQRVNKSKSKSQQVKVNESTSQGSMVNILSCHT